MINASFNAPIHKGCVLCAKDSFRVKQYIGLVAVFIWCGCENLESFLDVNLTRTLELSTYIILISCRELPFGDHKKHKLKLLKISHLFSAKS